MLREPLPDRAAYLDLWGDLHGGYDPRSNRLVHGWLAFSYVVARPVARTGIAPDVLTIAGGLVAVAAAGVAALGDRWLLLAAGLVVLSGLVDNLDGAVAVLTRRTSAWGALLDATVDRVGDAAYVVALWLAGAPGWLCAVGGGLAFLQEYARARAGAAGLTEIGVVTVAERPTRVVVTTAFLAAGGVLLDDVWPALGAAAWVGLGLVGLVQLLVVVRARLR